MRLVAGLAATALLISGLLAAQVLFDDPEAEPQTTHVEGAGSESEDAVADLQALAGVEPSAFSATPESTTTSTPGVTTTAAGGNTTDPSTPTSGSLPLPSTSSTTTTTKPPTSSKLVIPATLPYPGGSAPFDGAGGFTIMTSCQDTEEDSCVNKNWVDLDYWGHGLPYLFNENGSDGAWWLAGDRGAYLFAYGFLQTGEHIHATDTFANEEIIARFTIIVTEDQAYGRVNDRHMDEGARLYNGAPAGGGEPKDCIPFVESGCITPGVDYSTACDLPAWSGRVGLFTAAGEIVDIRDFSAPPAGSHRHAHSIQILTPGKFVLIDFNGKRASIGWCPAGQDGLGMHIYYDRMNSGRIAVGK